MMAYKTASPDRYEILREFARKNRTNMTLAESLLWDSIRKNQLGHKFLRQHIIGDYIVDFLCTEKGLVIEVDGGYHAERNQQESDEQREKWLESKGYRVVRFANEEIMNQLDQVISVIENKLK